MKGLNTKKTWSLILIFSFLSFFCVLKSACADLYVSIIAVNGTEEAKEKEIKQLLPKELKAEDILDTSGLQLDYDVDEGAYFVHGPVSLKAKETRTLKVRIRDLWKFEKSDADAIKEQVNLSLERAKGTEYYDSGQIKRDELFKRLDFIAQQQEIFADNIEKRIDRYRAYAPELSQIRTDSLSVSYWRSKLPSADTDRVFNLIVEFKNDSETIKKAQQSLYLPREVKPEHIIDSKGFDLRFDEARGESFLSKEEELKPGETKRYEIPIKDIWNIRQSDIDNLKDRTRKAYKLLEKTEYSESAGYLVKSIKENLQKIEDSQSQEKAIKEHISAYRTNITLFETTKKDVEALEDLLEALRENLERSKLRNVLQRVKSFKSVADIAEAIFGTKPSVNTAWKIISGIVIFVGLLTFAHFIIWGRRSKTVKTDEFKKVDANKEGQA